MPEPGQYQGKRLSTTDVTRLYAAGERDFRGAVLRGGNFRSVDLSGADFSEADIRSARFMEATLRGVNFSHARAGLQRRWIIGQLLLIVLIAALAGLLQGYFSQWIVYYIFYANEPGFLLVGIVGVVSIAISLFAVTRQGFTLRTLGSIVFAGTVAFVCTFALVIINAIPATNAVTGAIANAVVVAFSIVGAVAVAIALTISIGSAVAVAYSFAGAFAGAFAASGPGVGAYAGASAVAVAGASAFAFSSASLLSSAYVNKQIRRDDPKFENLRIISLALATLGGTTFSGADLSGATFACAKLKHTSMANPRQGCTQLTHVRWHQANDLDFVRLGTTHFWQYHHDDVGTSALQDRRGRKLLTTLNGVDQNFAGADLRGVNLKGAQLRRIDLRDANLNGATLAEAELQGVNLTGAQCVGTDFTAAQLTGACLEAWNIDETTILQAIDCQYVFLKAQPNALGWRERLPHNPDKCFAPGDFEKYFREVLDEVRLLIRGGVDPQAFKTAFQALMENHSIAPGDVRSISRRDGDVLIDVAIPAGVAKPDVARTFDSTYEKALPAAAAQALLEAERRSKQDLIQLANKSIDSISSVLSNLTIHNTAMNHSQNPNVSTGDGSFYAGGEVNLSGSTINLGEISGRVSNQINQIPELPTRDQPSLKDILTQLQTAAETDSELSDDEKAEALQAVGRIATAGTEPNPDDKAKGMVKRATATLKGMTETLTDASKLATACKILMPLIASLFALV